MKSARIILFASLAIALIGLSGCEFIDLFPDMPALAEKHNVNDPSPAGDIIPPKDVTGFSIISSYGDVKMYWNNPPDKDFSGVRITWVPEDTGPEQPMWQPRDKQSVKLSGFRTDMDVTFRIQAVDFQGNQSGGYKVTDYIENNFNDLEPPGQIYNLGVNLQSANDVLFTWTNPGDADHVEVYCMPGVSGGPWVVPNSTNQLDAMTLAADTYYTFFFKTVDMVGNKSDPLVVEILTTPNVRNLRLVQANPHDLDIAWDNPPGYDFDRVELHWRRPNTSDSWAMSPPIPQNQTHYQIPGLDSNTEYEVEARIRAVNGNFTPWKKLDPNPRTANDLSAGLVREWRFQNSSFIDSIGNFYLNGNIDDMASGVPDRFEGSNGALSVSDNVTAPNVPALTGSSSYLPMGNDDRSLCVWVRPMAAMPGGVVLGYGYAADTSYDNYIWYDNQYYRVRYYASNMSVNYQSSWDVMSETAWHFIVVTYAGGQAIIYFDGKQVASASGWNLTTGGSDPLVRVGDNGFSGNVDDIRIYNRALQPQEVQALYREGGWGVDTVWLDGGTFDYMGASSSVNGFNMSIFEVTQESFESLMHFNPSYDKSNPKNPVTNVTLYDAMEYCNRLSLRYGYDPVYNLSDALYDYQHIYYATVSIPASPNPGFRLPTDLEWVWAAMGGQNRVDGQREFAGDPSANTNDSPIDFAWFSANSGDVLHPIGSKNPNSRGIHDMSGNVWEWTHTQYGATSYAILGGAYNSDASYLNVDYAEGREPGDYSNYNIGFRVVR